MPHQHSESPFASRGGLKLAHALAAFDFSPRALVCADFGCSTGGFTDCLLHAGAARVYAIDTAYGQLAWKLRNDPRVVVMERTNCLHVLPPHAPASDSPSQREGAGGGFSDSPSQRFSPAPRGRDGESSSQRGSLEMEGAEGAFSDSPSQREGAGGGFSSPSTPAPGTGGLPARRPTSDSPPPHSTTRPLDHSSPPGVDLIVADAGWTPQRLLAPAFLRWLKPTGHVITLIKPHYELKDANPGALPRGGILDEPTARAVCDRVLAAFPSLGLRVLASTQSPILGGQHKGKGTGNIEFLALLTPSAQ